MNTEAETILQKARITRNIAGEGGMLTQRATRYLTVKERAQRETEKREIDSTLAQPTWARKDLLPSRLERMNKRKLSLDRDLKENAPPIVSGETKDHLVKRLNDLNEEIRVGMPSHEVMRRNPPGAVGMHDRWQAASKSKVIERKNILKVLDRDNEDPDYLSVEMLRPSGLSPEAAATFMVNAQIPGNFAMTELAKANWPLGEPKVDTAMAQAERREIAEGMAADGTIKPEEVEEMKEELKKLRLELASKSERDESKQYAKDALKLKKKENAEASRARMKKYWADKRAKETQPVA